MNKMKRQAIITTLAFVLLYTSGMAQVVLSEVCSKNTTTLIINGESPDYIELYNSGTSTVALEGYGLSDDESNVRSWLLPNIDIDPGEYLLILADDEDKLDDYAHTNFKLSDGGEILTLTAADGTILEELDIPSLDADEAYAIINGDWQKANPTPGAANSSGEYPTMAVPTFSINTGMYSSGTTVSITSADDDGIIEYYVNELDDLDKDDDNELVLTLTQTTTVCARADAPNKKQSPLVCHTYVIDTDHQLPILSVIASDEDLFDNTDGLFELGPDASSQFPFFGANFWSDGSTEVYFQYYDETQGALFQGHGDLEMHGGSQARTNPQKTFRLLAKQKYDQPLFEYPFFDSKPSIESYKRLVVRNASGDYNKAHCRDGFLENYLINSGLDIDATAYQPVAVYINGDYYGLMGLREKVDKHYTSSNYGTTDVDMLEEEAVVIEGDSLDYISNVNFVSNNDMAEASNYAQAAAYFDIPSLIDYFIAQVGFNNADWPNNNIKLWRPRSTTDSHWRYLLFDMDASMGRWSWSTAENNMLAEKLDIPANTNLFVALMNGLLDNASFRFDLLNRHQDLFNTAFTPTTSTAAFDSFVATISDEMQRQLLRWPSTTYEEWEGTNIPEIRSYLTDRPQYTTDYFAQQLGVTGTYTLTIDSDEANAVVQLNTLAEVPMGFEGDYYVDVPIRVTASDMPGLQFLHWEVTVGTNTTINTSPTIAEAFDSDVELRAVYQSMATATDLIQHHYIAGAELQVTLYNANGGDVHYELISKAGQLLQVGVLSSLPAGIVTTGIPLAETNTDIVLLHLRSGNKSGTAKILLAR